MDHVLFADFPDQVHADQAVRELELRGYAPSDISVITKKGVAHKEETTEKSGSTTLHGATTGGMIGGLAGLLAGAGVAPALAGLLIGGPIAAALGLAGVAAATVSGVVTGVLAGGLVGALTELGLSNEDAQYYHEAIEQGAIVLAISVDLEDQDEVRAVLNNFQAQHIEEVQGGEREGSVGRGFATSAAARPAPSVERGRVRDVSLPTYVSPTDDIEY